MTPEVLFVNSGILGLLTFQHFLDRYLPHQSLIRGHRLVLTEGITPGERIVRRLMCQRLWKDGLFGIENVDFARFRHELHAGLLARHRMRSRRYDVIHFHRQASAYGSLDLMRTVPSIVSIDCTQECILQTARGRVQRASYWPNVSLDGFVFRRAHAIVATSSWAADSIRRMYPRCTTPIHVMPNPVLLEWFDRSWIERRRERASGAGRARVLFIGGDFPRKGGYALLDAWEAGDFGTRADLTIVTDWTIGRRLPEGVSVTRHVAAYSTQWQSLWADADLFVMPTQNEAFGLVFQEAGAAGLPAIGTRHNAVPEIVKDGETGILVPVRDRDALVHAIRTLIDDPVLRTTLGARARRHIELTADPDRYFDALLALIRGASHESIC